MFIYSQTIISHTFNISQMISQFIHYSLENGNTMSKKVYICMKLQIINNDGINAGRSVYVVIILRC